MPPRVHSQREQSTSFASVAIGLSQQALIAEGIKHVLAKYGKPTVAT